MVILIRMQVIVAFLGCLMDPMSIMYITLPVFLPIVKTLQFDNLWFAILMMINLELGCIRHSASSTLRSKGDCPAEISMMDIFRAALWFDAHGRHGDRDTFPSFSSGPDR
jgi:TRAP-type mannitol/chloroaromatic compound transport system permease large subunit